MYSIVLMAALTSAPEAPDFGHGRCHCGGGYCGGYCGGWCGGYCGGWGRGWCGGYCGGWCGGWGRGWCGCYGGGYCGGWCGGGYCCGYTYNCYGGTYGSPYYVQPGAYPGGYPGATPNGMPGKKGEQVPPPKKGGEDEAAAPATLIVNLPSDARLIVDGNPTKLTSSRRVFVSPPLQQGKDYYYTLRAEIMRDGQMVPVEQRAYLRAGRQTTINLEIPAATVAASQD